MNEDVKVIEERIIALDDGFDGMVNGSEEQVNMAKAIADLAHAKNELTKSDLDTKYRRAELIINAVSVCTGVLTFIANVLSVKEQADTNRRILKVEETDVVTSRGLNTKFKLFNK